MLPRHSHTYDHINDSSYASTTSSIRHFRAFAVQPQWYTHQFVSYRAFADWMTAQFRSLVPHLAHDRPNLVVLTEFNGLPLLLNQHVWATRLGRFEWAIVALVVRYMWRLGPIMQREGVSAIRALQLLYALKHAAWYLRICRDLARSYGVYLCCGSLPMPRLYLSDGKVHREPTLLTNQSHILDPSGRLISATDKVFLTPMEEQKGLDYSAGHLDELRVFPTVVGDLGTAISLDAFQPAVIQRLRDQGCTVLLQPDANGAIWSGTEQILPDNIKTPRPQPEAWLDSAWQVSSSGDIRHVINAMVVGNLFDLSFDGQSAITGTLEEGALQSYVMTEARRGFLALMPWVTEPSEEIERIKQIGTELAAGSGHPRENTYHSGIIWADLSLPASEVAMPQKTAHEEALAVFMKRYC